MTVGRPSFRAPPPAVEDASSAASYGISCLVLACMALSGLPGCGPGGPGDVDPPPPSQTLPGDADPPASTTGRRPGNWRPARAPIELTPEQRQALDELAAVGYAAGVSPSGARIGVTLHDVEQTCPGLNLYVSGHGPEAILMDATGEVLHTWSLSFAEAFPEREIPPNTIQHQFWRLATLGSSGELFAIFEGLGLIKIDRDSTLLWAYDGAAHHDLELLADGRVAVLTRRAAFDPDLDATRPVLDDYVTLLEGDGREVESISLRECVERSAYRELFERRLARRWQADAPDPGGTAGGNPWGDLYHTNSLEWLDGGSAWDVASEGRLLVSMRNIDLIAVVDIETRDVPWAAAGSWRSQHRPSLLPDGRILLFDNQGMPRRSALLEIDPVSGEELWTYRADAPDAFFSAASGACQRLPNGNTLVTESNAGRAFELTRDQRIVWEFHSPHRAGDQGELVANLFEVIRVAPDVGDGWLAPH